MCPSGATCLPVGYCFILSEWSNMSTRGLLFHSVRVEQHVYPCFIRYSRACAQLSVFLDRTRLLTQNLHWSYVEILTTQILRSSSKPSWPKRNIHTSNDMGSFTFCVDVFFPLSLPIFLMDLTVYMSNTTGVL